jgi:hypothetical protein
MRLPIANAVGYSSWVRFRLESFTALFALLAGCSLLVDLSDSSAPRPRAHDSGTEAVLDARDMASDAGDGGRSRVLCIDVPGEFCEDFDRDGALRFLSPAPNRGKIEILSGDAPSPPKYSRMQLLPAPIEAGASYADYSIPKTLLNATQYQLSFYVRFEAQLARDVTLVGYSVAPSRKNGSSGFCSCPYETGQCLGCVCGSKLLG